MRVSHSIPLYLYDPSPNNTTPSQITRKMTKHKNLEEVNPERAYRYTTRDIKMLSMAAKGMKAYTFFIANHLCLLLHITLINLNKKCKTLKFMFTFLFCYNNNPCITIQHNNLIINADKFLKIVILG